METFVLGSASPRRKEILSYFDLKFSVEASHFDEEALPFNGDPEAYVMELAMGKSDSLADKYQDQVLLTADTIVYHEGKLYPKPKDFEDGVQTLLTLQGGWHTVFTGVVVRRGKEIFQGVEASRVLFNELDEKKIRCYHEKLQHFDKAAGYTYQGAGSLIVKRIEGCYYNIIGLPINTTKQLLASVGIDLWENLN